METEENQSEVTLATKYWLDSVGSGRIACYRPGLQLIDFYRTMDVLAKDVEPRKEKHEYY